MKKKPTVTVAVCAYNEEKNIANFLKSVLTQKEDEFKIKKIVVISDGSTDHTVQKAKSVKNDKIQLIVSEARIGKSSHLNDIYRNLNTDYLVQSDADVIFEHPFAIQNLIQPLTANYKTAMTGGNPLPLKPETFFEKLLTHTLEPYFKIRKKFNHGQNPYTAIGQLLAYKKRFIKLVHIPHDMIANDNFTYYTCLDLKHEYQFVESAIVRFRTAQRVTDHIRQNIRFSAVPTRMEKHFDKTLIKKETRIPASLYYSIIFKEVIKHPFSFLLLSIINVYCRIMAHVKEARLNALWDISLSTKKL